MFEFLAPVIFWLALMPMSALFLVIALCLLDDANLRRRRARRASMSPARAAT